MVPGVTVTSTVLHQGARHFPGRRIDRQHVYPLSGAPVEVEKENGEQEELSQLESHHRLPQKLPGKSLTRESRLYAPTTPIPPSMVETNGSSNRVEKGSMLACVLL
jgi:hypothetical protein